MEWVDDCVAIGSWRDVASVKMLRDERVDLIMDARALFTGPRSDRRPLVDRVDRSADLLMELARKNVRVLVRCHHGRDRSPFVVMVYVSKRYGLGYQEAYEMVLRKRPRTVLHSDWVEVMSGRVRREAGRAMAPSPSEEPVSPV